jgi:nucleotide-binding universal stress UspA family protein
MTQPTILAATDLSPRSAHVAGRAALLAEALGARIILAFSGPARAEVPPTRLGGLARAAGRHFLAELTETATTIGAEPRLLDGDPVTGLADLARDERADLIVLGLHRERRVLDVLRLTTMERIVLAAPCPALIAQHPPTHGYARVLASTDFSPASAAALVMAGRIAPTARFHAIHALQLPLGALFKLGHKDSGAALMRAEAKRAEFLATPGLPTLAEPPEIVPGGVHQVLTFRSEELDADLVAIGAHSGREPGALGNYARDLMRAPPTDLLVAKPD